MFPVCYPFIFKIDLLLYILFEVQLAELTVFVFGIKKKRVLNQTNNTETVL